jgi:hypothetical protein
MHSVLHAFTHSVVWASVIVALITTLAVEYLAKPGLEARKDRVLEKKKKQRESLNNMRRAYSLACMLEPYYEALVKDKLPVEHLTKVTDELAEIVMTAYQNINIHPPGTIGKEWGLATAEIHLFAIRFSEVHESVDSWVYFVAALAKFGIFYEYFGLPKWRLWRRRKLIAELKTMPSPSGYIEQRNRAKKTDSLPD